MKSSLALLVGVDKRIHSTTRESLPNADVQVFPVVPVITGSTSVSVSYMHLFRNYSLLNNLLPLHAII